MEYRLQLKQRSVLGQPQFVPGSEETGPRELQLHRGTIFMAMDSFNVVHAEVQIVPVRMPCTDTP